VSPPSAPTTGGIAGLRVAASIGRLHIVVIAALGTLTFGWLFTGARPWLLAGVCALDWFLVNLLNRVVDLTEDRANAITGVDFVAAHRRAILRGGLLLLVGSLAALAPVLPGVTPLRLAFHLLGLAYNWPLLPGRRRIKQLYFWKNTASTVGFVITVFGYPILPSLLSGRPLAPDVSLATVLVCGAFFFLFELSYEVIYDLRDVEGDERALVRSYPVVHGVRGAARIVDGLLLASMALLAAGYASGVVPWRAFIMIFAPAIQLVLYRRALRGGITSRHCIGLTWLGSALLATYHLWVVLGLPGAFA
jgi:4-hydroxybenzoate polyprenyltransferase